MTVSIVEETLDVPPRAVIASGLPRGLSRDTSLLNAPSWILYEKSFCDSIFVVCLVGSIPHSSVQYYPAPDRRGIAGQSEGVILVSGALAKQPHFTRFDW